MQMLTLLQPACYVHAWSSYCTYILDELGRCSRRSLGKNDRKWQQIRGETPCYFGEINCIDSDGCNRQARLHCFTRNRDLIALLHVHVGYSEQRQGPQGPSNVFAVWSAYQARHWPGLIFVGFPLRGRCLGWSHCFELLSLAE